MKSIDYINTYGKSIDETSIGKVIKDIMSLFDDTNVSQYYYTYNSKIINKKELNLFSSNSVGYKGFCLFFSILPWRFKKSVFATLNYQIIFFILLYIKKKIFRNNRRLIIVFNGQPIFFKIIKRILKPKKMVFICHGGSLKVYNKETGEKEILENIDDIVALNKKVYLELKNELPNIHLIPNHVEKKYNINFEENPNHFLYVGRIVGNKRVKELCEIFENCFKNTEFKLNVCGNGYGNYYNQTIDLIERSKSVNYLGYLNKDELNEMYLTCKYIVLISEQEGSPLCLIDSFAFKIIPIGNMVPGTQDFIEAFGGYLLPNEMVYKSLKKLFLEIKNNSKMSYLISPISKNQQVYEKAYFERSYKNILN